MTIQVDEILIATSIADLRTQAPITQSHELMYVKGSTGSGGLYDFDPLSVLADNGSTVVQPSSITGAGRWVKVNKFQDDLRFEQYGALVAGSFTKLVVRGGYYPTTAAILGTAGTSASTVAVKVNGVTVVTITFAIAATVGTVAYAVGSNFSVNDGDKITYTVAPGAAAADLAVAISA